MELRQICLIASVIVVSRVIHNALISSRPRLSEFLSGIKAELPILVGVIPFGMIFGVLAINSGISQVVAQAMSSVIFAGSAQFISTQLMAVSVPGLIVIITITVVNLRHLLYSASLAPYLHHLNVPWKIVLSYLLTDEAYAVTITYFQKAPSSKIKHWYFLGAGIALWSCWQISTLAGIVLGAVIPESLSLDFTLALTFIALLIPSLKDRSSGLVAVVSGVSAVIFFKLPLKSGLIIAAIIGILVGIWVEKNK